MTKRLLLAAALGGSILSSPAAAQGSDSLAYFTRSHAAVLPQLLSGNDQLYYRSLFEAIEAKN